MSSMTPLVSVVILNYNGAPHLPACLVSLKAQTYPELEIIVSDNGSSDDSTAICATFDEVIFVPLGHNYGFGLGNNLGARAASGKYLFFVNNDMRFEPDCVEQMVQVLESDEAIFSADARQYSWDGQRLLHARAVLRPASVWWFQYPCMRIDAVVEADTPIDVPVSSGANLMARKSMFDALGGFDETFFMDFEDFDLCWRAWLRGWRSVYVPNAVAYHKVGMASQAEQERRRASGEPDWRLFRQYSFMKNQVRFALKVMPLRDNLYIFLRQHVFAVYHLVKGKPYLAPCYLRAWWKNLLELGEIWSARREAFRHAITSSQAIRQRFWVGEQGGNSLRAASANQTTKDQWR